MTFQAWLPVAVPLLVIVGLLTIGILSVIKYRPQIDGALDRIETEGQRVKQLKDDKIKPWIRLIRVPADVLTLSRCLLFIPGSLWIFKLGHPLFANLVFDLGWLTDLIDGPRARYEAELRAKRLGLAEPVPTKHGPFLDPGSDILCDGLTIVRLWNFFPSWLTWSFGGLVALRTVYGTLAIIKASRPEGRLKSFQLLPESILGKYKRVVLFLAFGLIIALPDSPLARDWAVGTLALATTMEVGSLVQQWFRWKRTRHQPRLTTVQRAANE